MVKSSLALLEYLNRAATNSFAGQLERVAFRRGQLLLQQDEDARGIYVLLSGVVKCFITEENGRCFVLEFLGEGEILGELELLTEQATLNHVEVLTEGEAYWLEASAFTRLQQDTEFSALLLRELATRLRRTARRASYQQVYPLEYAVLQLLSLFDDHQQPISKQDLADYLAVPVRSLNRVLKYLAEQQLFHTNAKGQLAAHPQRLAEMLQAYW
ncbi:Crp/Fnr family transcriptional regulator [Hymenobacter terrenus]|uniref:Crp/Fnr family transcriptional regulator n=1 Tax=Hymenobacter terrenus TaxID=1629124 RepID=UPI0006989635|nr:Crp/Fnr family transcriptional regulator [Hymenobacter terrenus]